jgi:hypothetical protein
MMVQIRDPTERAIVLCVDEKSFTRQIKQHRNRGVPGFTKLRGPI